MSKKGIKHHKWTDEELALEALKYKSRFEFQKGSPGAYCASRNKGKDFLNHVCFHMTPPPISWTEELIIVEALKFSNIKAFQKGCQSAYNAAVRLDILDTVCSHMKKLHITWTFEMILQEALKYASRWSFQKCSPKAYDAAKHRKILDSVCSHMKRSPGHSEDEKFLLDSIKKIYPQAKKYREMKVSISGKPHIGGFELDIFVPELKKAIEYDGTYWHSFEGLKRRKPNWPDEDIKNYHKLKDEWFLSKGIAVLHITEKEWEANKNECINRTLKFLGASHEQQVA